MELLFPVLAGLITALSGTAASFLNRRRRKETPPPAPLEGLLEQLRANALEAGRLAPLVQAEIQAQLTLVQKLRKDATEAEQLAAVHSSAAQAIAAQVKAAVAGETRKSNRSALLSNILFFIAGVTASIFVTLLVRPIGS